MLRREDDQPHDRIEIRICANPAYLSVARSAIRKAATIAGLSEEDVDGVTLALDEALANVIQHSYGGPCGEPIIVRLTKLPPDAHKGEALEIVVRDFGKQVDPATIRSRDLDDIRPGGLGVHIIQSVMDEVEYSCPLDGGMYLRMTKYLSSVSEAKTGCG